MVLRRLDRYVFGEVLAPTVVGFLAYTGFMAVRGLVQFSELLVQSEQPLAEAGIVLALSLPHIVVLTLPVAFLLGLLIGIGRLSADSELTALRASGIDLAGLYRPIGALAIAISGVTLFLMLAVVPRTNHLLYAMKLRLSSFAFAQRIQPGVFSPEFGGLRVYVEKASSDRRELSGLIISDRSNPAEGDRLTLARRGWLELEEDQGRLWLRVEDAETHHEQDGGARYDVTSFSKQRMVLQDNGPAGLTQEKQIREQGLRELLARAAARARRPEDRRLAMTEVHKKFALPAACLVFGLIGLPLGIVNRRGGRAAGFAVSVAIVLAYYALIATGEARAIEGRMSPALAMWLPNILLLVFGLFALARVRRDRTLFELNLRAPAKPAAQTPSRAGAATAASRRRPMRLPGLLLIDRYVARRFLAAFALVVSSIAVLYVLIDYLEISDDIARHKTPFAMVLRYYQAFVSPILLDIVPFAFLVAALVTTASLVRSAETTALLSHGVSLHRAAAPLLVMAAVAGAFLFFFAERVVPAAAAESDRLRYLLKGQTPPSAGATGIWVRGEHGRFFAAAAYDPATRRVDGLTMLQIDPKTWHLEARTDTEHATVVPGRGLVARGRLGADLHGADRDGGPARRRLPARRPGGGRRVRRGPVRRQADDLPPAAPLHRGAAEGGRRHGRPRDGPLPEDGGGRVRAPPDARRPPLRLQVRKARRRRGDRRRALPGPDLPVPDVAVRQVRRVGIAPSPPRRLGSERLLRPRRGMGATGSKNLRKREKEKEGEKIFLEGARAGGTAGATPQRPRSPALLPF